MNKYTCSANIFDTDYESEINVWDIVYADSFENAAEGFCYNCNAFGPGTYTVRVECCEPLEEKVFKVKVSKTLGIWEDDE